MGKLSLLLVAAVGLTVLFATTQSLGGDRVAEAKTLSVLEADLRAQQAALSGYAEATQALAAPGIAGSSVLPALSGEHGGGTYRTTFEIASSAPYEVRVRVEAEVDHSGRGGTSQHVAEGTFRAQPGVPGVSADPTETLENVPEYMRYAAFAGQDLSFNLLPTIRPNGSGFNSNVHANDDLIMGLSLPLFTLAKGFGTYSDRLVKPLFIFNPEPNFRPTLNPDGGRSVQKTAPVDFPAFTALSLLQGAAGEAGRTATSVAELLGVVGDVTQFATELKVGRVELLGDVQLGTRENPKIIYVDGDLIVFNPRHHGYGIYIVEGNVFYEGTITGVLSWLFGKPESHVAYYADGSVLFNGLGDVHGQIVANGNVNFLLAPTFYGSVTARGDVRFSVAPTIRFTSPSPALTTILPGNPTTGAETMSEVSFREWEAKGSV